jgi:EmrB/QacA subfamily drug resistance transporter
MTEAARDPRRWWALAVLCTAFFMVILDAAIVVVALPSIAIDLGFSVDSLQWVVSAYALTFGGLLLLGGRAADLLGRRRVFMAGLLFFTAASFLCGLAWSDDALIAARAIQGVGAAVMTPTALSIITTTFDEGSERNKALGIWGSLGGVGASAGWLIGGPLVDGPGWEWIFLINIPIGILVLVLSPLVLRESRGNTTRRSYDPLGALTVTAGLAMLVYALVNAPKVGWSDVQTIALFAAAAASLAAFALIELRATAPLVPLRILRSRTLVGANSAMLVLGAAAYGAPFILTLYAQQVLDYSAFKFGATSIVFPLTAALGSVLGQGVVTKVGFRPVAVTGLVLIGLGCFVMTKVSVGGSYFGDLFPAFVLFGPGLGMVFVTCSIAALTGVRDDEAGLASGLNNTAFQIGAALGTAILSTVAVSRTEDLVAAGGGDPLVALTEGFQSAFAASVAFPLIGLVVALFLLGRRRAGGPHELIAAPAPAE